MATLSLTAFALALFVLAPAGASAAVAPKSVTGFFGLPGESFALSQLGGHLSFPRGTDVNQTTGNVYVADTSNNRISVFSSSGTFLRAFGQDVVESGPDNAGTGYEICVAANGDICKTGSSVSTGGAMSQPQGVALDGAGNVYVTDQGNLRVQKFDANGNFLSAFGQDVVQSGSGNSPATSAVQSLTITATAGKYTLSFGGKTTPELAFNASSAEVQTALLALTSIGAGNVEVTGAGFPYTITFKGALANNPEPAIVATSGVGPGNELEGGIVSLVNTVTGATGFETCVAANGDVCKKGVSASTGGAFKETFNGYLAIAPTGAPNAGDVLVADPANLRVQEFSSSGAFLRTFGFDVVSAGPGNNGTTNFEVCTAANGNACKVGVTGSGSGQFSNSVNRVAEDADGNLYTVESATNFRVQKFTLPANVVTPQGNFSEANLKGTSSSNGPLDVAIDPSTKDVLVTKAFAAAATANCPNTGIASVAERRIVEVSQGGALEATHMGCAAINAVNGIAVRGSTGDLYVSSTTPESRLYVLNSNVAAPAAGFNGVNEISAHGATVAGFVNPNGPVGLPYGQSTGYHVDYKRTADATFSKAPAVDVDLGKGTSNLLVSQKLVGLEAGTSYDVRILASRPFNGGSAVTSTFTFSTPAAGAEVGNPSATTAATETAAGAALYGSVSPNSKATTYHFEYGTTTSYGTKVPAVDASVGSGASAVPVAQFVNGLLPETTYHFRIVAKNGIGGAISPDQTFTTPPLGTALPDGRAPEQVSPNDKRPVGLAGLSLNSDQLLFHASSDGESILYPIAQGLADTTAGGDVLYLARRGGSGSDWSSAQVTPPALVPTNFPGLNDTGKVSAASPDNSCQLLDTYQPLTADTPKEDIELGVKNLYRKNADGTYTLLTDTVPLNHPPGEAFTGLSTVGSRVTGVSADCRRVFFVSPSGWLPGAPGELSPNPETLYEWEEGSGLRMAAVLPDGSPPSGQVNAQHGVAVPGGTGYRTTYNSFSDGGSRAFFSAISHEGGDSGNPAVFVRKNGTSTVDASQSQTAIPNSQESAYQMASADGSHVFFTSRYGLAPNATSIGATTCANAISSGATGQGCDLYDYNVDTGNLTDLSADANPADLKGASVIGVVDASEDGSRVYFAARGQLVPGKGNTEAQNLSGTGSFNVYLSDEGELSYVGPISKTDTQPSAAGGSDLVAQFTIDFWVADATPDGSHLLFASKANVTGYVSGGSSEAYLYSASTGEVTCVSCRPDGLSSVGNSSTIPINEVHGNGAEEGLRPRSLSNDGRRVFFSSPDVLVPGAESGVHNLYEWEGGRIHLLLAGDGGLFNFPRYFGASASGDDVFLATNVKLVPQDFDNTPDVYDLRAPHVPGEKVGPEPAKPVVEPCDPLASECQGTPAPQPGAGANTASEGLFGPGNPPTPPAKKHRKKHHKKPHKKHHKRQAKRTVHNDRRASR